MQAVLDRLARSLPAGYSARPFEDHDREALVAARNREVHPLQTGDAEEWRVWERVSAPKGLVRVVVADAAGDSVAMGETSEGVLPRTDGAHDIGVGVAREHRRRGIGGALLDALEDEARRRGAPMLVAGTREQIAGALEWATARGYREIGRRIESYVELASFDPTAHRDIVERAAGTGVRLVTFAERLDGASEDAREAFFHELWEAEGPMWDDIPWARPRPHWPYEQFRRMAVESGQLIPECSVVALDGDRIVGLTMSGKRQDRDGYTWMTGVGREHRGHGIAFALKVESLRRAKDRGMRAMLTTNDEPNKAMRGINARLRYRVLPAHVELEKAFS